ncbi:MAG: RNA-binding transcriptional accessory protein [Chloroflexi bacterium]|uniref:RNA-binding transcriptional accessory protein n=1 Tax=Candidatus Chlorohelix allophototropha TaxID=3003348 RepID=A0A8T7MAA2_9CHLR|nr:RNA-binding transcriptional accessory protein [Chloroflexota bacterium]
MIEQAAAELKLRTASARNALELLDEGATIPFISRYRKEVTGNLDEEQLRQLEKRVTYLRQLSRRKQEIVASIEQQGKLTAELKAAIEKAVILQEIEDLYLPYRPKRHTRATAAREKGLEPLANLILSQKTFNGKPGDYAAKFINPEKGVDSGETALSGARDIVAEQVAEDANLRRELRQLFLKQASFSAMLAKGAKDEEGKYQQYYDYAEPVAKIPPHRILAINRGESEEALKVNLALPPGVAEKAAAYNYPADSRCIFRTELETAIADSLKRLLIPSLQNEVRAALTEQAEAHAIKIFAANLRQLLLQPPLRGMAVLGIDPGFRTGCKVAVIDTTGKPIANLNIYPHEPKNDWEGSKKILLELTKRFKVNVFAIGNGTASRETEMLVAEVIAACPEPKPSYVIVSEAGASVYSASELARKEFPDLDVTQRGNISIARRLQDPLAELVKVEPKAIGVGLYQHDVDQKTLGQTLDAVVESCVNYVGVNLNTASSALLRYVSGINRKVADSIVTYRETKGSFKTRRELLKVPGLGEKAFEQAAGFLKIPDGTNPLDNTFVHPESYEAATKLLSLVGLGNSKATTLPSAVAVKEFRSKLKSVDEIARQLGVGALTLSDILDDLEKPGRDPRDELPKPILRNDVLKLQDLKPGMVLKGTVRNVIDFGAFVDIGLKQDGLVHITEMSNRFIKHPLDVVQVGQIIEVKVLGIDEKRGRVSLSMKLP